MGFKIKSRRVDLGMYRKEMEPEVRSTMPPHINVPIEPLYGNTRQDHAVFDEQQVSRVEILMTKGIRNRNQLAALLNIPDARSVDRYITRVHARWEMTGTTQDHARHRGEGLNRLDLIESELWAKLQNQNDTRVCVVILNTLVGVQKQRSEMLGLTPKVIERIGSMDADSVVFTKQVAAHEHLSQVAARMLSLIEERTKKQTIEHVDDID
jgi:hypothetical protein